MKKEIFTKKEKDIIEIMSFTSLDDIVTHYPFRYETIEKKPYQKWLIDDKIFFEAKVITSIKTIRQKGFTISRFDVVNEDDTFHITIFNRPWLNNLKLNTMITIFGKYDGNQKVTALKYNLIPLETQLGILPVYALKNGVSQTSFINLIKKVLKLLTFDNAIPLSYLKKYRLISKQNAMNAIHFPKDQRQLNEALRHLKYEEFLKFQMIVTMRRCEHMVLNDAYRKIFNFDEVFRMANNLSFSLTLDQVKALNDILADLSKPSPMYRLIQGDVGCGKTIVAAMGLYANYLAGFQSAFMAPTEVLVKQQYAELKKIFKITKIKLGCLYSSLPNSQKTKLLMDLQNGNLDIVVGTHSLIQDNVVFKKLGMIVTDEQHRFGVAQRRKLSDKGNFTDFLVMSATPIPRTLTNVLYGDMDVSNIYALPKGRKPVITRFINQNSMISILDDILSLVDLQNRCYVVCPAIEDDNDLGVRNTTAIYNALKKELPNKYKIGLLHGKMDSNKKDQVLNDFKSGLIDFLVTTTVVEVGVNIKEANIMVIYDANRFGLAQLHQLRGRIKRSSKQGYCYLLSDTKDELALKRMQVLVDSDDGFKISEEDLKLRGPGDIFGTRQSGLPTLVLGNVINDANIIRVAKEDAVEICQHPTNENNVITNQIKSFIEKNDMID